MVVALVIGASFDALAAAPATAAAASLPGFSAANPSVGPPPADPVPPPLPVYPRLALLETALALGGGIAWYNTDSHFNAKDWDYNWNWSNWNKRLITYEAVRLDDNAFGINAIIHPLAGTGIYLIARGNRLGPLTSFLFATAESAIWEWVVEYREVVSINDMIFTPIAAIGIGEPMVRVSSLLRAGYPGPIKEVLATILNPIDAVNGWFEGRHSTPLGPTDANGLPLLYRHRLEAGAGVGYTDFGAAGSRNELEVGGDAFVDATPTLGEPGRRAGWVGPGALNWLAASLTGSDWQIVGARIFSEVALAGWLIRQTHEVAYDQPISSHSLFLGIGTGFEYASRWRPASGQDQLGIVRLPGALADWGLRRGKLDIHLVGDLFYDFAMAHALALAGYVSANGPGAISSVLAGHGYYYAQGVSTSLRLVLEYDRLEAGASLTEDDFWSIRARQRFPSPELDPAGHDRRGARRLWLAVRPLRSEPWRALLLFDQVTREGRFDGYGAHLSEIRLSVAIDVKF